MPAAAEPHDEHERLAALIALNILETERTADFDVFPALASQLFSAPIAAMSLIDKDRQWFKASVGLDVMENSRDVSFCAHAILCPDEVLYVPDATQDPRFADNPQVVGDFGLRFYAGVPIIGPSGHALGTICVIDSEPRNFSEGALEQLKQLAIGVGSALRLHASMQAFLKLSMTDPLTGLENRAGFNKCLSDALTRPGMPGPHVGLLFLDLDGFKSINDLFEHASGDVALQEVAQRLRHVTRTRDKIARFGGDEFCILTEDVQDIIGLGTLAARIHAALAEPFMIDRQVVPLRTSIGIATYPQDATNSEALIRKADAALYEAKRAGRGTTRFATKDKLPDDQAMVGRNAMRVLLRDALLPPGREPFTLAVQPIFHGQTRQLAGFEALVRWPGPGGCVRPPSEFIPLAETTGLVVQLDRWVLDQACAAATTWPDHLTISSNLSAASFYAGDLVQDVREALERHGLAPGRLKLEVTETVLLRDPARVQSVIRQLRDLGVQIVLDDFGAGHASIAYLRDYAFSGLKIDRSFTASLETDPRSRVFVRAIIEMACALGLEVIVEGVETPGQLRLLRSQKITALQGYLLGRPMAPDAASDLIIQSRPSSP
ncbi:MAG: GGDEF domain-containing protein [Proteobacteria bacterium]|nr:MAG: GGDEF domain-containing protein [Pseudomonadota bacterium]